MAKKKNDDRGYFPFFRSFYEAAAVLPDTDRLAFYDAITEYGLNGNIPPNLGGMAKALFVMAKPNLDNSRKQYLNGKKGGAPKDNRNAVKRPTINEVRAYCEEYAPNISADRFLEHCEAQEWKWRNPKIKDWRDELEVWRKSEISKKASNN